MRELGLRGGLVDAWPSGAPGAGNPDDEPFWETVNELAVPISLHMGVGPAGSMAPPSGIMPGMKPQMAEALLPMVSAGVFVRNPNVRIIFAHGDAGWALHWMEFLDANYIRQRHLDQFSLPDPDLVPSDYLRRHAWFTFHQDRAAVRNRRFFGLAHLMWASHLLYEDSNFPDDRQQAMRVTAEVPDDERAVLLAGNVGRLYGLDGHGPDFTADEINDFAQIVHL